MYIVTKHDTVQYQGDSLVDFLYQYFEFKIEKGEIKIRDINYQTYINKDFHTMPTSYNKDWKKDEIVKDFIRYNFINFAKRFDYEIYKCEKI